MSLTGPAPNGGHWETVYQDISHGPDEWDDQKSLETLLLFAAAPAEARELSCRLLERFGSLSGAMDANPGVLKEVLNGHERMVALLKLIPALGRKAALVFSEPEGVPRGKKAAVIATAEDAKAYLAPFFYGYTVEAVFALYLNGGREVIACRRVSQGSETLVHVDVRRLAAGMLDTPATGLYLAHNHPRGRPCPSRKDRETTKALAAGLARVGLELLDHFIFADGEAVSLNEYEEREKARDEQTHPARIRERY